MHDCTTGVKYRAAAGVPSSLPRGRVRVRLALELNVSLRMVDMMLADGEITPMRLRGKLVRFYLPDVLRELREKAKTSKRNVARRV